MKKQLFALGFCMAIITAAQAQQKVKDGTLTGTTTLPNANAVLELESNNKGIMLPRVALTDTSLAAPLSAHVKGMVVYDTATNAATGIAPGIYYNDGTRWVRANSGIAPVTAWQLLGNTGTGSGSTLTGNATDGNYLGTTDTARLVLGVKGIKRFILDTMGNATGGKNNIVYNLDAINTALSYVPGVDSTAISSGYSFVWGKDNVDSSYYNTIFGYKNRITGVIHSTLIAGENDTVTGTWGWGNAVFGTHNYLTNYNGGANVIAGIENRRIGTATSSGNGGALFGYRNVDSSSFSSIVSGIQNIVGEAGGSSLVEGYNNRITGTGWNGTGLGLANNNIVAGSSNIILNATINNYNDNTISGNNNKIVNAGQATVYGSNNKDSASYTLMTGQNNIISSTGTGAIAFGTNNMVNGAQAAALGQGTIAASNVELAAGRYNQFTTGNATGWDVTDPLIQVGVGTDNANRANAVTVLKNGYTAIGTHTAKPTSTLQVNGSEASAMKIITANYTLTADDYLIVCDFTGATPLALTLPDPAGCTNRTYKIVSYNQAGVTFSRDVKTVGGTMTSGTATIKGGQYVGALTATGGGVPTGSSVTLQSNGTSWYWVGL